MSCPFEQILHSFPQYYQNTMHTTFVNSSQICNMLPFGLDDAFKEMRLRTLYSLTNWLSVYLDDFESN